MLAVVAATVGGVIAGTRVFERRTFGGSVVASLGEPLVFSSDGG
jgi:hypothetical protein